MKFYYLYQSKSCMPIFFSMKVVVVAFPYNINFKAIDSCVAIVLKIRRFESRRTLFFVFKSATRSK